MLNTNDAVAIGVLEMGAFSYGYPLVHYYGENTKVRVGKFCSIAGGVEFFLGANHPLKFITTFPFDVKFAGRFTPTTAYSISKGDINVGNDVWLGYGVTVMSGVSIGHGAIIAAKSVVTRDVPPYAVAAGSPAVVKKKRFTDEQIAALLKIAWWDWPLEKILHHADQIFSPDIDRFCQLHLPQ